MDQYIGKMLDDRYEILELIGSGGMANVYKARCHRLNRLVAIKILKSDLADNADFRRRFHDESQAVAQLSHANIVSVYDVSTNPDREYIVMELIDGITLKQYMERRGRMDWRESLHFISQIMRGLSHAHSRGIIHRDIKPGNIMISEQGVVKVMDFGIARALAVEPEVLLMDEPTSALDPISTSKIEELATNLKEQYTIIIVTHNMQQALRISDKTAFFLLGELIEYDDTEKMFSTPTQKKTEDYITGRFG